MYVLFCCHLPCGSEAAGENRHAGQGQCMADSHHSVALLQGSGCLLAVSILFDLVDAIAPV